MKNLLLTFLSLLIICLGLYSVEQRRLSAQTKPVLDALLREIQQARNLGVNAPDLVGQYIDRATVIEVNERRVALVYEMAVDSFICKTNVFNISYSFDETGGANSQRVSSSCQ